MNEYAINYFNYFNYFITLKYEQIEFYKRCIYSSIIIDEYLEKSNYIEDEIKRFNKLEEKGEQNIEIINGMIKIHQIQLPY